MDVLQLETLDAKTRERLLNRPSPFDEAVKARVQEILKTVREQGDEALRAYTERFDRARLKALRVPKAEITRSLQEISAELGAALETAKAQIEAFHRPQLSKSYEIEPLRGLRLGQLIRPFRRVGIYVPRNLFSSLLMAGVPAHLAGVKELAVCTPPGVDGKIPVAVRAAATLLGIDEVYAVGGAQAIAAFAYGTQSIPRVEKIVGPGNAYVTAAKALVRDQVAIDLLAGPSEVLLLVEKLSGFSPESLMHWALAELKAQLEHGPGTSALLLTSLPELAQGVVQKLDAALTKDRHLAVLCYSDRESALEFANEYAPEHLGLWTEDAEELLEKIQNAGSVFLGPWSPVAFGDYASGTNHILPTARGARVSSGLGVSDFLKKISYQHVSPEGYKSLAPTVAVLAKVEGMAAHAESVRVRLERLQI